MIGYATFQKFSNKPHVLIPVAFFYSFLQVSEKVIIFKHKKNLLWDLAIFYSSGKGFFALQ